MPIELTPVQRLDVDQAIARLQTRFAGKLNTETIARFVDESLETIMETAKIPDWVPLLAERFAADRLRALVRLESDGVGLNPSVLFLCVHNAGRSQMAAGWMRHITDGEVDVFSGGSEPAEAVNDAAVAAMAEKGIDIAGEIPQPWADEIVRAADVVVTMGCGDACPIFPGKRYVDWEVADPAGRPVDEVRVIRDDIEARVRGLISELGGPAAA